MENFYLYLSSKEILNHIANVLFYRELNVKLFDLFYVVLILAIFLGVSYKKLYKKRKDLFLALSTFSLFILVVNGFTAFPFVNGVLGQEEERIAFFEKEFFNDIRDIKRYGDFEQYSLIKLKENKDKFDFEKVKALSTKAYFEAVDEALTMLKKEFENELDKFVKADDFNNIPVGFFPKLNRLFAEHYLSLVEGKRKIKRFIENLDEYMKEESNLISLATSINKEVNIFEKMASNNQNLFNVNLIMSACKIKDIKELTKERIIDYLKKGIVAKYKINGNELDLVDVRCLRWGTSSLIIE